MKLLEIFKNKWKPNYNDSSFECFCFRTDINNLVKEIRAEEREKAIEECKEVVRRHWINGTVAHRIAEEIYEDLEDLK